jgi:hypothetical protein
MSTTSGRNLDRIAAVGLIVGAMFGLAGTLVGSPDLQAILWAIDSVGLVFAIGEGVLLSGTAAGPSDSVPAFAAGEELLPTSSPLPFFGYPFLVANLLGWAWTLTREPR